MEVVVSAREIAWLEGQERVREHRAGVDIGTCASCDFWRPLFKESDGTLVCADCYVERHGLSEQWNGEL
jgi:hypothetical protein